MKNYLRIALLCALAVLLVAPDNAYADVTPTPLMEAAAPRTATI